MEPKPFHFYQMRSFRPGTVLLMVLGPLPDRPFIEVLVFNPRSRGLPKIWEVHKNLWSHSTTREVYPNVDGRSWFYNNQEKLLRGSPCKWTLDPDPRP